MRSILQDLQYAIRQLRHAPAFSVTAILTLALGIGVNAAMFSVVDQVLLRAMPFPHAEQVVEMAVRTQSGNFASTSYPDIVDWQARSHSFQQIGFYTEQVPTLGGTGEPKLTPQIVSSANLFTLLQAKPLMGRTFLPEDAASGRETVVVLSANLWRGMFHGDPEILGRTIPINGIAHTVIGVMPQGFSFPANTGDEAIWTPLPLDDKALQDRGSAALSVVGRLRPGVTLEDAMREMNQIHEQLKREYPKDEDANPIQMKTYQDVVTGSVRPALLALDAAVIAVWLIACANVAGLLLARGNNRRRELALRTALGAGRGRLVRQMLTESLLLSFAGGALGLALAFGALRVLKQYLADAVIFGKDIHVDATVCFYLLAASCISAMLFGLMPALQASGVPAQEGLRQGTAGGGTSRKQTWWRDGLVVGEIALTLTLLVAAGLMVRTLIGLRHTRVGFVASDVTTAAIYLPNHRSMFFDTPKQTDGPTVIQTFYLPLLERIKALGGIDAAGLTTVRPLQGNWDFNMSVEIQGQPRPPRNMQAVAQARATTAEYFQTMGIRLMQGRFFASTDQFNGQPVAIVNQAFEKRFFPNGHVLGQGLRLNDTGTRQFATIVGVIEDTPQKTLGMAPVPEINYNLAQLQPLDDLYPILGSFLMNVAIRSTRGSESLAPGLRRAVHDLDPEAALDKIQTMQQVVDDSLGNQALAARLLGLLAFSGLLIAVAGIYGLLAYSVSQRTRELGVRLALGAQRGSVLWLVLRHALVLLGVGMVLGALLTAASGRLFASFLAYRLSGQDALVAMAVAVLLGVCGLAASYLPARRAARIDPVVALRNE